MLRLTKIISGGQFGVDLGALRAARALGFETGGWMPRGFVTENGAMSHYAELYNMVEHHDAGYAPRTKKNVDDSDGTIIIGDLMSAGSKLTGRYATAVKKPIIVLLPKDIIEVAANRIIGFVDEYSIKVLNVAGNRESKAPGIQRWTEAVMRIVLGEVVYHVRKS